MGGGSYSTQGKEGGLGSTRNASDSKRAASYACCGCSGRITNVPSLRRSCRLPNPALTFCGFALYPGDSCFISLFSRLPTPALTFCGLLCYRGVSCLFWLESRSWVEIRSGTKLVKRVLQALIIPRSSSCTRNLGTTRISPHRHVDII